MDKKKKEEEARKKHQDAIERTMKKCLESAEKADTALKNNDMETLGVLSAAGDMVAEERYIQYYISKIRDADATSAAVTGQMTVLLVFAVIMDMVP